MKVLEMVHGIIWGPWTVGVFLVVGLVLSVRAVSFRFRDFGIGGRQLPEAYGERNVRAMKVQVRRGPPWNYTVPVGLYRPCSNGGDW